MAFSIGFFCSHSVHNVTLRRIQNLNGFFYRIFLFTLRAQRDAPTHTKLRWLFYRILLFTLRAQCDAPTYTKLRWLFYRILLFTLRAQCDAPTYTKLEWLFYRIFLFTLRAQHDAPTYTKTTNQCGARSGSPQLGFAHSFLQLHNENFLVQRSNYTTEVYLVQYESLVNKMAPQYGCLLIYWPPIC